MGRWWCIPAIAAAVAVALVLPGIVRQPGSDANSGSTLHGGTRADGASAEWLGALPANLDLVVVVNDATRLRKGRLGAELPKILGDQQAFERVTEAWSGLAKELGWSDNELFDRLIGRRIALVARTVGEPAETRWAVLATISRETELQLRSRLRVAPRAMVAGQQVLSLEKGAYELATRSAQSSAKSSDTVEVVLGPAGQSTIFDEMVARPAATTDRDGLATLGRTPVFVRATSLMPADLLFLMRPAGAVRSANAPTSWDRFIAIGATSGDGEGNQWRLRIGYRDPAQVNALKDTAGFTLSAFESMSRGASLTMMQANAFEPRLSQLVPIHEFAAQLELPAEIRSLFGQRGVLRVEVAGGEDDKDAETKERIAARRRLVISSAVDLSNVRAVAGEIDSRIAAYVRSIEHSRSGAAAKNARLTATDAGAQRDDAPFDYGGMLPNAVRVLPFEFASPRPDVMLLGGPLTLAWGYRSQRECSGGGGWWAAAITPAAGESAAAAMEAETRAAENIRRTLEPLSDHCQDSAKGAATSTATSDRWLFMLQGSPKELESALPALLPDMGGFRSAMRRFTFISAKVRASGDGELAGEAQLRLSDDDRP